MGISGPDFGMPSGSFADPDYVAQEKMIESMTVAYNWIALNSTKFASGCGTDKPALAAELVGVIQAAQETSKVCTQLASEASQCNPEIFCSMFNSGQLPFPPEMRAALKKAGYDPSTLKVSDITTDVAYNVCISMAQPQIDQQKQATENAKAKIQEQLPAFRAKCEEFKKWKESGQGNEIRLPDFGQFPQGQQNGQQQGQQIDNYVYQPQQNQQGPQGGCQGQPPDCGQNGGAFCDNGNWVCPVAGGSNGPPQENQQPQQEQQPQEQQQPVEQPTEQPPQESQPAPESAPAPEPAPLGGGVQAIGDNVLKTISSVPVTWFVPLIFGSALLEEFVQQPTVCGDTMCSWDSGENDRSCPQDCRGGGNAGGGYGNGSGDGYGDGGGYGRQYAPGTGPGMQQGQQGPQGQQNRPGGPGPSPEMLCGMSDDEIVEMYSQGNRGGPQQAEVEYRCKTESGRIVQEMNRYKLEIARCNADAALECAAKQQAVTKCNEMKDNPEKAAGLVVDNMCRRFGTPVAAGSSDELYQVANKWYDEDPALANQLGDTADKTAEDQKKLDIGSYLFGNGDYGAKLKERAAKLREIKARLVSNNVNDPETIATLDAQATELETEASKFSNFFDMGRIGYMFR
ncbi:MAG: hypothetical protein AABW99_02605 [archaeon]